MSKKESILGVAFLLAVLVMVCAKGVGVEAKEFPVLVPDGEYEISMVTEYEHADYSCSFKLIIEKSGYYYFKEKTEDNIWWVVKKELNAGGWWFGQSVWYLEEGTYYIGAETYSGDGYPCVKVFSAECEFDLSKVQTSFETTSLVYSSNDVVKQWTDNASVKVYLSDGTSFTTSLEGVWLRPVLYKNGKALYAIGNTDFDRQEYVVGGDYEVRLMNYAESYCQDSKDIKIKTCSVSNIPETSFDKDMKVNEHDKFALNVTKPSYVLVKNIYNSVFVDSDGNVLKPRSIDYYELAGSTEVIDEDGDSYTEKIYNHYNYIYISNSQKIYVEVMEVDEDNDSTDKDATFYQMQVSMKKTKDISNAKYYDEFLYDRLEKVISCYDIQFESENGKVIRYSPEIDEFTIMIDERKWEEYRDENYKIKISEGMHKASFMLPNGTEILNFNFESSGSIRQDDEIKLLKNKGVVLTEKGEIQYIKIQRDNDGNYVLINPDKINEDLGELNVEAENINYIDVNRVEVLDEYVDKSFYVEIDNTSGDYSKLVFAELLDEKLTAFPSEIQNISGSEKAAWLKDKLDKEVELTLITTMGEYKVDYRQWSYRTKLLDSTSSSSISEESDLPHGWKFNYVIYRYDYEKDDDDAAVKTIKITINNTSYKNNQQSQPDSIAGEKNNAQQTSTQIQQDNISTSGQNVQTAEASYKITNDTSGQTTISYQAPANKKKTTYSVPDIVKLSDGTVAKVTEIVPNAFANCKNLKKVTIGKNVEKIGKNAFKGCKKLKTIKIKSTKLTKKSFGKNAFKGINKKATITVPKKVYKNYKKWLKNTGLPKSVKIKK